ncbi:zinc-ribbon domain-containing protein [uncultured Pseudoflavonifractor sp.]|uniref:zinc-ribbon domain-containing protein n=1 Tax=uncultured Pseudoflavonifractor sp. TaxID=1221379 RepID=UPI00344C3F57
MPLLFLFSSCHCSAGVLGWISWQYILSLPTFWRRCSVFCPNCGFPYGPDDRFCGRCGAALPAREDASPASPSPEPSPPRLAQSGGCPGL